MLNCQSRYNGLADVKGHFTYARFQVFYMNFKIIMGQIKLLASHQIYQTKRSYLSSELQSTNVLVKIRIILMKIEFLFTLICSSLYNLNQMLCTQANVLRF